MRRLLFIPFFLTLPAMAAEPGYDLSLGAQLRGGTLQIHPTVTAPAGKKLRYEMATKRSGRSGQSNSSQSGSVSIGADGRASLAQYSVSVGANDRYEVKVDVYDGQRLVASESLRHPQ